MKTLKKVAFAIVAMCLTFVGVSCEKEPVETPVEKPTIGILDVEFDAEKSTASVMIVPSTDATAWYYKVESEGNTAEYTKVEGAAAQEIEFEVKYTVEYTISAYAENKAGKSDVVTKEFVQASDLEVATITISKPMFDEATMTLKYKVTPSENTAHWYWGIKTDAESPAEYEHHEGNAEAEVSIKVEYDREYIFVFAAQNAHGIGEKIEAEFMTISPVVEIAIENLTQFSLDAVISMKSHCVKYAVGAVHTDAYNRNTFIEEAQRSLNPDADYPFAVYNTATESKTFSEQDLVRNSLITSEENAGIMLVPGTSYTIAVYGEDAEGRYNVTTKEFVAPTATLNGNVEVAINVTNITEKSATVEVSAAEACKIIVGYMDPEVTKVDTDNPFDFEGKSDEEISNYLMTMTHAIPTIYSEPIEFTVGNLGIGETYYAYAIAIKDGKVGEVTFEKFTTVVPKLSGISKITGAEILEQTSHEIVTVKLMADSNATKVRLYAAPETDHAAYAENLEFIMNATEYQNYREEYTLVDGVATAEVAIYHPGSKYYMYAVAVDGEGKAGEMVCVATLAGHSTEYYTTIEEIVEEYKHKFDGTGTVDMVVTITGQEDDSDRISLTVNTDNRSANADKVWLIRFNGTIAEIEDNVKYAFSEWPENRVLGSYKEAKVGYPLKYEDGGSSWDPKYEALQEYSGTWGGDVLVAVVLDTDGKLKIHSYYAAGGAVTLY
ncbi:MAG: hypothetical protein J6U95_01235 [Alistipes sp.]|nr:hypothetical protein [Alistipes sp.]